MTVICDSKEEVSVQKRKSFTTKCRVDEDNVPEPCRSVNEEASHSDADSDVVQITPLFLMDSSGTPVVEPEVVIDSVSDENSANSRNTSRIPSSFSPGVMDCVKCTACCYKIQPFTMPFSVHPLLKRCTKYCEKQDFAKDESGKDENCKWCSDGGDLVCCDNCSHAICKKCIRQNLGRTYLRNIESLGESDTWNCFVCDPTPIKALQDNCSEIVNKVAEYEAIKRRRSMRSQESRRSRNKSQVSEPTVGDVFNSSSSPMNFMIPNTVESELIL
ncbi:unnamed protein product [Trichobilharzia regenti]|nr:unnamed protein product [Trichobilharzia regenti]